MFFKKKRTDPMFFKPSHWYTDSIFQIIQTRRKTYRTLFYSLFDRNKFTKGCDCMNAIKHKVY